MMPLKTQELWSEGRQSTLVVVGPVKKELHKMSRGLEGLQESCSGLSVTILIRLARVG